MKKVILLLAMLAMVAITAAPALANDHRGDRNDVDIDGNRNTVLTGDFDFDVSDEDLEFDDFDLDYDVEYDVDYDEDDAVVLYYLPLFYDVGCPFYGDFDGVVNHYDCFD